MATWQILVETNLPGSRFRVKETSLRLRLVYSIPDRLQSRKTHNSLVALSMDAGAREMNRTVLLLQRKLNGKGKKY